MKLGIILAALLITITVKAQITISPMEFLADIKPGESKNFEVNIFNGSSKPLKNLTFNIKEYNHVKNMNMIDTVKVQKNVKAEHEFSIVPFVKADKKMLDTIEPRKGTKVTINVTIPKDYKKGLGFFAYTIEPSVASMIGGGQIAAGTKTQFFGRSLLNVVGEKSTKKINIIKTEVSKNGVVTIEIANKGDKVLEIQGDIIILDKNNKQLGKFDLTNPYSKGAQLTVPLDDVSYQLNTAFPPRLIVKGNQLLITLRDLKQDYSEAFVKVVKAP